MEPRREERKVKLERDGDQFDSKTRASSCTEGDYMLFSYKMHPTRDSAAIDSKSHPAFESSEELILFFHLGGGKEPFRSRIGPDRTPLGAGIADYIP